MVSATCQGVAKFAAIVLATTCGLVFASTRDAHGGAGDIVLYASTAPIVRGHWSAISSSTGAAGRLLQSTNSGWASTNAPLASPANYFELTFDAPAATTYQVWLRLRATVNSKWNDSVWVQFSDATLASGAPVYRIGTTSALLVNLERCNACGVAGWGWKNDAYWLRQETEIRFAAAGKHTIRVQTREDGVEIDQIVLSATKYLSTAPGAETNDSTIVPVSTDGGGSGALTPFKGTPIALPGTVNAADFDNGGQGVAHFDTTTGNSGGVYRDSDVDIQAASTGGYNVGWMSAGEWLKYTVNVATAATYNIQLRVASTGTASIDVAFNGASRSVAVPNTGGWQAWTTVTVPMALTAGQQVMTVRSVTGGANLRSITVARQTTDDGTSGSTSGGSVRVMTWNIAQGRSKAGVYDPAAQARYIATHNPHVVLLQEVQTWDENQPAKFKNVLEQVTGVPWTVQWAPVIDTAWTEGNVVLTRLPVVSSSYFQMHATSDWTAMYSNRSVAQATVRVGGVALNVFSTHLDYYNTTHRTAQLLDMMAWVEKFSPRRIVGGDFNSSPSQYWAVTMKGDYYDTWEEVTGSASGGYTINGSARIDYLFEAKEAVDKIIATKVFVPVTSLSDHNPVIADYMIKP